MELKQGYTELKEEAHQKTEMVLIRLSENGEFLSRNLVIALQYPNINPRRD